MSHKKMEERYRLQIFVPVEVLAKIDELAGMMKMSRSDFVGEMITSYIGEEEMLTKFVCSRFMEPVVGVIRAWHGRKKKTNGGEGPVRA